MMMTFTKLFKAYLPVIVVLIFVFIVLKFVVQVSFVPSRSMEPTIHEKTLIVGNRLSSPSKGDIIIFKKGNIYLTKRIIACGGDQIEIKNSAYYINGIKEKTKFAGKTIAYNETKFAVPRGCFFVSGDNREHSNDSRYWNDPFVKKEEITSKVIFKGW